MRVSPPVLPTAPREYSVQYMDSLARALDAYFRQAHSPQDVRAVALNLEPRSLPTQDDLAGLRKGDVYVDTSQDNVLKVKL